MTAQRWLLGIEIGGTKLQAAIGTSEGDILYLERGEAPPSEGAQGILAWYEKAVPKLLEQTAGKAAMTGIGVGFGGPVETATGRTFVSHQVPGWEDVALKTWFEERFNMPTVVANDSNAAGWAEYCLGAGKGTRHFCYNNIGSGIGGALIIDGKLHDGQGYGAGEIGHMYVPDWTSGAPGAADKLENLCSGWSIERKLRATAPLDPDRPLYTLTGGNRENITCAILAEAARQGDTFALESIDKAAHAIGMALANVITLFHPERIAVGGGVGLMGDVLLEPVRRYAAHYVFAPYRDRYAIVPCALGESVVLAGAMLLASS